MHPFFISPTEAFWLGFALEEYREAKQDSPDECLIDFLPFRLRFDPDMKDAKTVKISASDVPEDVEWFTYGGEVQFGLAASVPNATFHEDGEAICKSVLIPRKFLKNLLMEYLSPHMATSLNDRFLYCSLDFDNRRQALDVTYRFIYEDDDDACRELHAREKKDDVASIAESMLNLAAHNDSRSVFGIGRSFASMIANCHRYEKRLDKSISHGWTSCVSQDWKKISHSQFVERFQTFIKALEESPGFSHCRYSLDLLQADLSAAKFTLAETTDDPAAIGDLSHNLDDGDVSTALIGLQGIRQAIWFGIGEFLGTLHDADTDAKASDRTTAVPRMFALSRDSTPDRITGQLLLLESQMERYAMTGMTPATVISMLKESIEALAKKVWPSEFQNLSVGQVLGKKLKTGNKREKRFASIATSLYHSYRNPDSHEYENFDCTWTEARHFLLGIRTLLEMSKKLRHR